MTGRNQRNGAIQRSDAHVLEYERKPRQAHVRMLRGGAGANRPRGIPRPP
ncbi:hypothetical protein HMPREF0762_00933 [Slackia exigua ATCC 700122]|uniref:Uncharacterized protein n=1 Tax=Slackia exigua (strain ATCC 700122 / DSM 15923 / CIP 105133 / JCM 11022 / KCTC 5966 / S-7) TaxID=649764 RepID=D0WGH9_SLAES|nr:hypothetical protein HMPREF0762_00933 [Slackia exigua ATCC 700122]